MTISVITGEIFARHDLPEHPECNCRLIAALAGFPAHIPRREPERADEKDIAKVHDPAYLQWLRDRCRETRTFRFLDPDTYVTPASYGVAAYAAGGAIGAVSRTLDGEHCFAMVRPPGHHAERNRAMGFCLVNNAAVAAAWALSSVDRVAIVDWDVHHGNGTQHAFYADPRVLYCSTHQADNFPYTGRHEEIGVGDGKGYTLNAPLMSGATMADYDLIFREVFAPAIRRMRPGAVIVSAGQDVLSDDPLGGMELVPGDLGRLTAILRDAADVPLAFVLEGGYGPSHATAMGEIVTALENRKNPVGPAPGTPRGSTVHLARFLRDVSAAIRPE